MMKIEDQLEHLRGQCEALSMMLASLLALLDPPIAAQLERALQTIIEQQQASALANPNVGDKSIEAYAKVMQAFMVTLRDRAAGQGMQA